MNQVGFALLSIIIFVPIVAGIAGLVVARGGNAAAVRAVAIVGSLIEVALSLWLYFAYQPNAQGQPFQFVENARWMPQIGVSYHLGVDGLSMFLVIMTAVVTALVVLFASPGEEERAGQYFFWLLALESAVVGVFMALDLVLFYIFFEAMLVPMYFLIGGWGGPRRQYAAVKFFLYTLAGSLLMLVAIIGLRVFHAGAATFDYQTLASAPVGPDVQVWFFLAFALAFAIKAPIFPLHTWLPDAYVEAPTGGSVMLAAVMSKVGAYGFLRFCLGLFPTASHNLAPIMSIFCIITILYGAWGALSQRDLKGLIAYSSLGHLGLIILGIFALNPAGLEGSTFQMVSHGISTAALFLIVGAIARRWGTREIPMLSGIQAVAPALAATLLIFAMSSMPLPGLNGFPGEFLIFRGVFAGQSNYWYGIIATLGVILAACYMIWMYGRIIYTAPAEAVVRVGAAVRDLTGRDWLTFAPALVLIIALGFVPGIILSKTGSSALAISSRFTNPGSVQATTPLPPPALTLTVPGTH